MKCLPTGSHEAQSTLDATVDLDDNRLVNGKQYALFLSGCKISEVETMDRRRTPKAFFDILVRRWQMETANRTLSGEPIDPKLAQATIDREFAWKDFCDSEELLLGEELAREIHWALEGMDFARFRAVTFNFREFPKIVTTLGAVVPEDFIPIRMNYPLHKIETKQYRAALVLFTVAEFYLWMGAIWDRMGQFLNLFAFGIRNVTKTREGWWQIFGRFRDNYGHVRALNEDEDFRSLVELHQRVYAKISLRRNLLAHRGSLIGRIRAGVETDPTAQRVFHRFILGNEDWDLSKIIPENEELAGSCFEASQRLFAFVGHFLSWRREAQLRTS
jgi:hypothetical protein